jgi:DNA polymerase-3 subunit alpha
MVTVGGIVTGVREGFTKRGTPFGIVTIEDYGGAGEIAFFDDWAQWRGMFMEGSSLFIKIKYEKKFPTSTYISSKVISVEYLANVRDKLIRKLTLRINVDDFTELDATELLNEIEDSPGEVEIDIQCHSVKLMRPVNLVSRSRRISVKKSLMDLLDNKPAIEYMID